MDTKADFETARQWLIDQIERDLKSAPSRERDRIARRNAALYGYVDHIIAAGACTTTDRDLAFAQLLAELERAEAQYSNPRFRLQ